MISSKITSVLIRAAAVAAFVGVGMAQANEMVQPAALSPQPAAAEVKPGLAVEYYYTYVRHIDELKRWMEYKDGDPGEPVPMLDYNVGNDPMLTSRNNLGVGAHMTGMMHFKEPGTYAFAAMTNDGFEFNISDEFILWDPDVHFDRWSEVAKVQINEPGWYPVEMFYFQRKGTSTLELYWRPPWAGADAEMAVVPAEVFGHIPDQKSS